MKKRITAPKSAQDIIDEAWLHLPQEQDDDAPAVPETPIPAHLLAA